MESTITRTIYFYQIQWLEDKSTKNEEKIDLVMKDHNFFNSILTDNINSLHEYGEDYDVLFENDSDSKLKDNTFFGKISKIRNLGLPLKYIKTTNEHKSLGLKDNEGLYEPCHFGVFDGKILLSEFNFYGPRVRPVLVNILNKYFSKYPDEEIKEIRINPIMREDPIKTLENFTEIRNIEFQVATDYAKKLKDDMKFRKMFASEEYVEKMFLKLSYSLGRGKPEDSISKFGKVIDVAKSLLNRDDFTDGVRSLKVYGKQPNEEDLVPINLAEQIFKTKRNIAKLDNETKAVNSKEMYKELKSLYIAHKDEIKNFIEDAD